MANAVPTSDDDDDQDEGGALTIVTQAPPPTQTSPPTPTLADTATATFTPTATPTNTPTNTPETAVSTGSSKNQPPTATQPPPPLPTPQDAISETLRVPILMYHYISEPPENADVYRTDLSVPPDRFRRQMQYLADNGYTPIDLYDLSRAIVKQQTLPDKPVILTFDDGYVDNYQEAFPILREFGFVGTFFIVTEFVDRNHYGYMTWDMIEEMAAAGMRIEPHSRTHPDLRGQEWDYLVWQTLGPQETIAAHIGYTPRYFSYPSGRYDADTIKALQASNFWGAVTTRSGKEHGYESRFYWSRMRVRNNTPLPEFIDLVSPDAVNDQ